MKTNLSLQPITGNALVDALRAFEAAHAAWMDTSVFTEEGKRAKAAKDDARSRWLDEHHKAYPSVIVI